MQRKDSVAAAVILSSFFDSPGEAVIVKPWRPQAAGGAGGTRPAPKQQPARQQEAKEQEEQQQEHEGQQQRPGGPVGGPEDPTR